MAKEARGDGFVRTQDWTCAQETGGKKLERGKPWWWCGVQAGVYLSWGALRSRVGPMFKGSSTIFRVCCRGQILRPKAAWQPGLQMWKTLQCSGHGNPPTNV
jgi:hypothetical protein